MNRPRCQAPQTSKLVLSADGAYVPLVKGEWAEVRTLAIGAVEALSSSPDQEVQTSAWSYFSRLTDAATFADLAEVETRRRGVTQAAQVCAVTDGADWRHRFIDLHRPDALRILDFAHAAQRLGAIADLFAQVGHPWPPRGCTSSAIGSSMRGQAVFWRRFGRCPAQNRLARHSKSTVSIWRSESR